MAFRSKHGITTIKKGPHERLAVSLENDMDPKQKYPSLLFTPNPHDLFGHYHISLTPEKGQNLHVPH